MSLWMVDDATTRTLMKRFYDALAAGAEPAAALSRAQASLRDEQPDRPFAWAAFVCQGLPRD
jgi:CHAT domain-containing protein